MNWPTSQDYNEAIQNAASSFSDSALKGGEVAVNAIGLPVPRSGNFADVYQFTGGDGKTWALKCFTRKVAGLQERYTKIDEHIGKAKFPFTVGFQYLAEGILVRGQWFPLLKMEWVEGFTLNEFVRNNAGKPNVLHALMQMWAKLCARLRDGNFAHADLQHGNVLLVTGDAQNKLGLKLIDYDGMWVPSLADYHSGEIGHPNFQHPLRLKDKLYNGDVDRFPHLVIASALRATVLGSRDLWDKFDNGDNLLFKEADLRDPGNSKVFKALWEMHDDVLCVLVGKLALASKDPMRKTPWLDDLLLTEEGERLTDAEEKKVLEMLGVGPHFTASKSTAPATPVAGAFADFEVIEDEEDKKAAARREQAGKNKKKKPVRDKKANDDDEPKRKGKSLLPYYIGGGVAAVAIVVGVIIAMSGGGKGKTPQEVVQNDGKVQQPGGTLPPGKKESTPTTKIEPPKKEPTKEVPVEVKKDPPVEIKKDPMAEVVDIRKDRPPPLNINTPSAVLGVAPIPNSRDVLMMRKGIKNVYRFINDRDYRQVTIGQHQGPVRSIACAPDGTKAVSGGEDNLVRVWALDNPRQLHALKEHTQAVTVCAVSPDSKRAVSIGLDSLLCEWDINEGKLIRKSPIPACLAAAYLPDGKTVLLGTANESALLFDLEKQQRVRDLPGHKDAVNAVCVSPDGATGYTAGDDAVVRVWNLATGDRMNSLIKHSAPIVGLSLSPSGHMIVSAGSDNLSCTWKTTGAFVAQLPTTMRPRSLTVVDTGDEVALGTGDDAGGGILHIIHFNVPAPPKDVVKKDPPPDMVKKDPPAEVMRGDFKEVSKIPLGQKVTFSPDGGQVAVQSGLVARIYSMKDFALLDDQKVAETTVQRFEICPDGNYLVCGMAGPTTNDQYGWDPRTKMRRFTIEDLEAVFTIQAMAPKANSVLVAQKAGGYCVYSMIDGKKLDTVVLPTTVRPDSISCTSDGESVLVRAAITGMYFRPDKNAPFKSLARLDFRSGSNLRVRLSPDAKHYLHIAGNDRAIHVYRTSDGKKKVTLEGHTNGLGAADFTADSQCVVSAAKDKTVRIWNIETGAEIKQGALAFDNPLNMSVSPDNHHVAVAMGLSTQVFRLPDAGDAPLVKKDPPVVEPPPSGAPVLQQGWKVTGNFGLAKFTLDQTKISVVEQGSLNFLDIKDGKLLSSSRVIDGQLNSFFPCPNDRFLVAFPRANMGLGLQLCDAAANQSRFTVDDVLFANVVSILPKSNAAIISTKFGGLGVYSLKTGALIDRIAMPVNAAPIRLDCTENGEAMIMWFPNGLVYSRRRQGTAVEATGGSFPGGDARHPAGARWQALSPFPEPGRHRHPRHGHGQEDRRIRGAYGSGQIGNFHRGQPPRLVDLAGQDTTAMGCIDRERNPADRAERGRPYGCPEFRRPIRGNNPF